MPTSSANERRRKNLVVNACAGFSLGQLSRLRRSQRIEIRLGRIESNEPDATLRAGLAHDDGFNRRLEIVPRVGQHTRIPKSSRTAEKWIGCADARQAERDG